MIEELYAAASGRDPSFPLALAALLGRVDSSGCVTLFDLTAEYRRDYIQLQKREFGSGHERGVPTAEEVARHLQTSVLPRLAGEGMLEPVESSLSESDRIRFRSEVWDGISDDWRGARERLLDMALEAIRAAEFKGTRELATVDGSSLLGKGLTKSYRRRRVVDHVDVEVRQGEIVGLLGPNGAGKTTTFYMIVGLERPEEGRIYLDGEDISTLPMYKRARRGIGYLAQEPSVFRKLTVEENILAVLETLPISDAERKIRLASLLDELSISHLRKTKAYQLSGGERRRLEITRALVTQPRFMLLDEPFAGVDPIAVNDIQTIVAGLRARGIGVLITDHNVEQTLDIVDRAYIMFEGKVQVSGTVRELVFNDEVAHSYLGPTLTSRLRERLGAAA
ncbi:MAG: LPS export ABC transporter ATP-binding protein [Gemmatimonadales bacterium]